LEHRASRLPYVASVAVLLTGLASVATPAMAGALTGSTFDIDIAGFNSTGTAGAYVVSPLQVAFGSTQVFDGAGINGQDITVSSSETVGATTTTDTIIISTPTNFLTTATINGTTISDLQLDLGDGNAGGVGIALTTAILSSSATGFLLYNSGATMFGLGPANDSSTTSLSGAEGVLYGSAAISALDVNEFEIAFTYANPVAPLPEPDSFGVFGAGLMGLLMLGQRRRLTR
jgi:hypothetical protein